MISDFCCLMMQSWEVSTQPICVDKIFFDFFLKIIESEHFAHQKLETKKDSIAQSNAILLSLNDLTTYLTLFPFILRTLIFKLFNTLLESIILTRGFL